MSLKISDNLKLPVDVAGEAIGILAKRGAGKTNTAVVLVEEMVSASVQVVVLDPVGVWWGLRAGADGSRQGGLSIPVIGGEHGDVALEPTAGSLIADVVVDSGQSLVIDLSEFSKTQQRTFVAAFAIRLFTRKARVRTLLHVVLEEADEFAPQRVTAGDAPMVGAIAQLVKRGRSRGIGMTFVTQRSASLNKDVLDQADVLIAMRTGGPRDRKAIEGWIEHQDAEGVGDVLPSLPGLDTGEAWVWNPERSVLKRVQIRRRRTFDSSATPKAGERKVEPKSTAPIDLAALGERIQETADKAKQNDPAELRRRIVKLERELRDAQASSTAVEVQVPVEIEVPLLTDEMMERLVAAVAPAAEAMPAIQTLVREFGLLCTQLADVPTGRRNGAVTMDPPANVKVKPSRETFAQPVRVPAMPPHRPAPAVSADGRVSGPQQRILNALAALETIGVPSPAKTQLALFAEASPKSSAFSNNLGHLNNQLGLISYPSPGRISLTDAGRELADAGNAPSTAEEVHAYVFGLVGATKARLLEQLIAVYPQSLGKAELAERAGASATSSAFSNNLGSLRSLGLIDYPQPGQIVALEVLFP